MRCRICIVVAVALAWVGQVQADVALPSVFSDHMVLQAGLATPIFGTAAPGEQITVEFNSQKKTCTTDKDGKWLVKLDPMKAGGPFELRVKGKNALTFTDVLVGEVWLASGQSNMRFPLSKATDAQVEMARADFPQIRYFMGNQWVVCSPQSCSNFSATAYFFAVAIHQRLKVPVGIIENAVSGAVAQTFVRKAVFDADPELLKAVSQHKHDTGANGSNWDTGFAPIVPVGIKGALWFQGEGNRDYPVTYRRLLAALITDWRKQWGQGDFPFLICQLTGVQERKPEPWEGKDCALREAQLKVTQAVPNTALIVTCDLNEGTDVHFPNKKPCGQRCAVAARALAYGEKIEYSGPIFESARFDGGRAIVSFTHTGSGLMCKGDKLLGFLLCGADRKWVRADAKIEGKNVIVFSDKTPNPVAVRYAWERNPQCNLYNKEDLPASPFRSDTYENYFTRDGD